MLRDKLRGWLHRVEGWVFYKLLRGIKEKRVKVFAEALRPVAGDWLLDIGAGGGDFWREFGAAAGLSPSSLRMVGVDLNPVADYAVFRWRLVADGRRLPFKDGAFDIVFSNSVIEHVGDLEQQRKMAAEVQRVGRRYFVQVPAKYFPIEPHYFLPFLSYLPVRWRVAITRGIFGVAEPIHLPTHKVVKLLFPDATIKREKMFGMTKAFLIVKAEGVCTAGRKSI